MGLLRIDFTGPAPRAEQQAALLRAVRALPENAPVTFLVHGYRYTPGHPRHDPHDHILSSETRGTGRSLSWVRHLGFRGPDAPKGLCVAVGWPARGTIWRAYGNSGVTAKELAKVIIDLNRVSPGRPVNLMAHSLGARVALHVAANLPPNILTRVVLMSAAAFLDDATAALESPAGRTCEFINVTSRENDVFDLCMEIVVAGGSRASVGLGVGKSLPNWIDLQLDDTRVLHALYKLGFPVDTGARTICHWSTFRRPGVFALYRALLCDPVPLPLAVLAESLPRHQSARWSRLFAHATPNPLLPRGHETPF